MDIESYFDENNITYHHTGKNISYGWIGIQCPFCNDTSNHCGISPDRRTFSCWRCKENGSITKLIAKIENISFKHAQKLTKQFSSTPTAVTEQRRHQSQPASPGAVSLDTFLREMTIPCRRYLESRNFDPEYIWEKYTLFSAEIYSEFKYRIVIPVFLNGKIVTLLGRDITGKSDLRYKTLSNNKSVVPAKECVYNIDTVKDSAVVVEGCFDVFRIGDGCVATLGVGFTKQQARILSTIKNVFIMYDKEAGREAERLANEISAFVEHCEIITIDVKDPAEMSDEDVKMLRKDLQL